MGTSPYQEIIEAMIKKYIGVVGQPIALRMAREIKNLEVADDGAVKSIGQDGFSTLEVLHDKYTDLLGLSALTFSKLAISPFIIKYKDIKLPAYLV
jgi:hypothetical protein